MGEVLDLAEEAGFVLRLLGKQVVVDAGLFGDRALGTGKWLCLDQIWVLRPDCLVVQDVVVGIQEEDVFVVGFDFQRRM